MSLDPSFIGSVLNALPLDQMISTPLQAMISAQIQASKAYADFLLSVCIKNGKALKLLLRSMDGFNGWLVATPD